MVRKFSDVKSKTFVQSTFTPIRSCGDKCCEAKASTNSFAVANVVVVVDVVVRSRASQPVVHEVVCQNTPTSMFQCF